MNDAIAESTWLKAEGRYDYLGDINVKGALEAVLVRSPVPHARLVSIEVPDLPENTFIYSAKDIPGKNKMAFFTEPFPYFAQDEIRWLGEPVAIVCAPDKKTASIIAGRVKINYEPLDSITNFDEAVKKRKPYCDTTLGWGDADAAFKEAARVIETVTTTGAQEHLYLEKQGALAVHADDGSLTVYSTCQGIWCVKREAENILGRPCDDKIEAVLSGVGGGFGGKIEPPLAISAVTALAASLSGKPVRLVLDPDEDLEFTTKRHPSKVRVRSAIDADGHITATESDIILQAGGYVFSSPYILDVALKHANGGYHFPAFRVRGRTIGTNTQLNGAFRGFGAPQAYMAIETHMCRVARELGRSALDLKKEYLLSPGDETVTGGTYRDAGGLREAVDFVARETGYDKIPPRRSNGALCGRGLAFFTFGAPYSEDSNADLSNRQLSISRLEDGTVHIESEITDMGQGIMLAHRKIAAETLGLPLEKVFLDQPRTSGCPSLYMTGASMGVVCYGEMVRRAALKIKEYPAGAAVSVTVLPYQPDWVKYDMAKNRGDAFHAYTFGAVSAEAEVCPTTGLVRVTKLVIAQDSGTPIDKRQLRGQLEGGLMQGLGYAVSEEFTPGVTNRLHDYVVPTFEDMPEIICKIIENHPYKDGPFGAKCAGEAPLVVVGAAVAEAVSRAIGKEILDLPITAEHVLKLLRQNETPHDR